MEFNRIYLVTIASQIRTLYDSIVPEVGDFHLSDIIVLLVEKCVPYVFLWWALRKAISSVMNVVQGGDLYI